VKNKNQVKKNKELPQTDANLASLLDSREEPQRKARFSLGER